MVISRHLRLQKTNQLNPKYDERLQTRLMEQIPNTTNVLLKSVVYEENPLDLDE